MVIRDGNLGIQSQNFMGFLKIKFLLTQFWKISPKNIQILSHPQYFFLCKIENCIQIFFNAPPLLYYIYIRDHYIIFQYICS